MLPRPDPAPLSETELAEIEMRMRTSQFSGAWLNITRLIATVRALQQRNKELREGLREYGYHLPSCRAFESHPCECGWSTVQAALQEPLDAD